MSDLLKESEPFVESDVLQPMQSAMKPPVCDLSLVIPLFNEEESLNELYDWISHALTGRSYEVIFVDDGSKDGSWAVITALAAAHPDRVRGIRFSRNYGKSAGLNTGFKAARGRVVVTMDADLQDSPDEIAEMERRIVEEGLDLVSGWKQKRYDPLTKTLPTKLYNWATRQVSGIQLNDFNCGLKAYRYEVVKAIDVQGEMHRYIPILAKDAGFDKIGERVVQHQARKYGSSKFGVERFVNGLLDLMTIGFMSKFSRKPMHLFGALGLSMFVLSLGGFVLLGAYKLWCLWKGYEVRNIADLSIFFLALTGMILGAMFFLTGFLAEMISRLDKRQGEYQISDTHNLHRASQ